MNERPVKSKTKNVPCQVFLKFFLLTGGFPTSVPGFFRDSVNSQGTVPGLTQGFFRELLWESRQVIQRFDRPGYGCRFLLVFERPSGRKPV